MYEVKYKSLLFIKGIIVFKFLLEIIIAEAWIDVWCGNESKNIHKSYIFLSSKLELNISFKVKLLSTASFKDVLESTNFNILSTILFSTEKSFDISLTSCLVCIVDTVTTPDTFSFPYFSLT